MIASLSQDDRTQVDPHIALDDACHCFPGRPHRATLWRWALHGVSRNGERIRLRTVVSLDPGDTRKPRGVKNSCGR